MQQPSAVERLLVLYARHFPTIRTKMRVVDRLWRVAAGGETHRIASLTHGGMKVPCDLTEMLQRQFYFFGTYFLAKDVLACWEREARGAGVVVDLDVGANAGIFSLAALAAGRDWLGRVAALARRTQTIRIMNEAGYSFAAPGRRLEWKPPGDWMTALSVVVARRPEGRNSSCR